MIKPTDYVGSLAKGILALEALSAGAPKMSVTDVSNATGLDRATSRRCLLTLVEIGYAKYDGKFFSLTLKVLSLGSGVLPDMQLSQVVQPYIEDLSAITKESISVSVLDGTDIVYVARAAQRRVLSVGLLPGSRLPAYCTSMGRILLGALSKELMLELILSSKITPRTHFTQVDTETVMASIANGQKQGYVLVDQEIELGLRSIAVPIKNTRGQIIAALNTGVSAAQVTAEQLIKEHLPKLNQCSKTLESMLAI